MLLIRSKFVVLSAAGHASDCFSASFFFTADVKVLFFQRKFSLSLNNATKPIALKTLIDNIHCTRTPSPCHGCASRGPRPWRQNRAAAAGKSAASFPTAAGAPPASITTPLGGRRRRSSSSRRLLPPNQRGANPTSGLRRAPGPREGCRFLGSSTHRHHGRMDGPVSPLSPCVVYGLNPSLGSGRGPLML